MARLHTGENRTGSLVFDLRLEDFAVILLKATASVDLVVRVAFKSASIWSFFFLVWPLPRPEMPVSCMRGNIPSICVCVTLCSALISPKRVDKMLHHWMAHTHVLHFRLLFNSFIFPDYSTFSVRSPEEVLWVVSARFFTGGAPFLWPTLPTASEHWTNTVDATVAPCREAV